MTRTHWLKGLVLFGFAAISMAAARTTRLPGSVPPVPSRRSTPASSSPKGPAADGDGNVYFSDIPNERIHKVDVQGKLSVFREKSNHANGLMVNAKGEIVACEMDGQVAAYQSRRQGPPRPRRQVRRQALQRPQRSGASTRQAASTSPTPRSAPPCRCRRARRPSTTPTPPAR